MKKVFNLPTLRLCFLVVSAVVLVNSSIKPGYSQEDSHSQMRAANLARFKAEELNGGLSKYRAASCMYQQRGGDCLVKKSTYIYTFRFLGGEPGWQQLTKRPSIETEVEISLDGRSIRRMVYNGPLR